MKKVDLITFSQFIIHYFKNEGLSISPLKLQKILYYLQVWHIVFFSKEPLFEELPEAWVNGPVYRKVYNKYKGEFYRNEDINLNLTEDKTHESEMRRYSEIFNLDPKQIELIMAVLKNYGALSDNKLVWLSHKEQPWNDARKGYKLLDKCEECITIDMMFNYYKDKISRG